MGDSFQFAGLVDGNGNNFLNYNDLTTGLVATRLPSNTLGDSIDSIISEITSGTLNAPVTSVSATIDVGVICNFDVTNDGGIFNGTCNGYLIDTSQAGFTGASQTVLNGGATVVNGDSGSGISYGCIVAAGTTLTIGQSGNGIDFANTIMNGSLVITAAASITNNPTLNGTISDSYDYSLYGGTRQDIAWDAPLGLLIMPNPFNNGVWTGSQITFGDRLQLGPGGPIVYAEDSPSLPQSTDPGNTNVRDGIEYEINGTPLTGTLSVSGGGKGSQFVPGLAIG